MFATASSLFHTGHAGLQVVGGTKYTQNGFEETFGINHPGHFLLVDLLLWELEAPARVVVVSSGTHNPDLRTSFRSRWRQFLILGGLNAALPFTLIAAAEINITASLTSILNSTTPLFTAVVAALWIGEPLTVRKAAGLLLGVAGVAVLVGWNPQPVSGAVVLSVGASLAAALAYGLGGVYAKRAFAGVPPLTMALGQQAAAAAILLPLAAATLPGNTPSLSVVFSVLALASLSTALAYLLYFRLITNVGPTKTLSVTFLVPVFGVVFGVLLLGEPFGPGTLAGMGIVLAGVALVTGVGRGLSGGAKREAA